MNDRELLELAAKAAGYDYECTALTGYPEHDQHQIRNEFGTLVDWNPLADDGDALRLAVKLTLKVSPYEYLDERRQQPAIAIERGLDGAPYFIDPCGGAFPDYNDSFKQYDPYAATRRAIVRAAAEIGKGQA
jgi:hypothetical protein